jgi:hypothetical protein
MSAASAIPRRDFFDVRKTERSSAAVEVSQSRAVPFYVFSHRDRGVPGRGRGRGPHRTRFAACLERRAGAGAGAGQGVVVGLAKCGAIGKEAPSTL